MTTTKPKPRHPTTKPAPFVIGQRVRLLTDGGYREQGAFFSTGSVHPITHLHGQGMGVSLRAPSGGTLYFSPHEVAPAPQAKPRPVAARKRRYRVYGPIHQHGDYVVSLSDMHDPVAMGMSRTLARKVAAMLNGGGK